VFADPSHYDPRLTLSGQFTHSPSLGVSGIASGHPRQRLVHSVPVAMPTCRYKSWFGELVGALRESKSLCCGTWLPSSHDVVLRLVLSGSLIESVTVTSARRSRVTPKFW
jgi:hypothetical protein